MSQFDFPRINFHGSVLLDVPTGNNGKFSPLKIYNQDAALPYRPPRVNISPDLIPKIQSLGYDVQMDPTGQGYVEIASVTDECYDAWAICLLGKSGYDDDYVTLYQNVPLDGPSPQPSLYDGLVQPGYWNYFGDLSVYAEDIRITGIQIPDNQGRVTTYTPDNSAGCPGGLAQLLGQSFSFHQQFFDPNSRTTAMFCDVDSINDTCTQLFISLAGIYGKPNGQEKTFLSGVPCKSTFTWLSLSKVLNYNNELLMPMSGGTYFESTIALNADQTDAAVQQDLNQYAGFQVDALSMKILLHQVYEVRNPDYSKMPTTPLGNNQTSVYKNPARVAFSGSLCPFVEGVDMKTHNVARILKNEIANNPAIKYAESNPPILAPTPMGTDEKPLSLPKTVQLPPAFVRVNDKANVISLDVINSICEYGVGFGPYSDYGGDTSIPPFISWKNYDFGQLTLMFIPDDGTAPTKVGSINHAQDYNMSTFLARGGVMDFPVPSGISDFSKGRFAIYTSDQKELFMEDDYLIMSDQQGSYAEQGQLASEGYKSDGAGRGPVILRCFYRGTPLTNPTLGKIRNGNTNKFQDFYFSDGVSFEYFTKEAGCVQYVLGITPEQYNVPSTQKERLYFAANGYTVSTRVLSADKELEVYLNGTEPLTFQVLYDNILSNYNNVLPIMNAILPFQEEVWSEPYTMRRMLMLTDEKNWGGYMYMPVTRELSKNQQALLQMWAKLKINS
ncbi:hypothetical protein [Algoriphagus sp. CAU 1675]|uniref:hypothetical protein n=1 Tax=Algoriphagus sp. CAU 1675 TaxID=3032597 RepID=UPI0023DB8585|nr:hypothetical protein [Algoriphagus sp. CAU 1675]MDF2156740.1 hypothetical protein [Algoriphagus sp. CAU 1675]